MTQQPPPGEWSVDTAIGKVTAARRVAGLDGPAWAVRSTLAGKALVGLRARRRLPQTMYRARQAARADATPVHARGTGPTTVPAVVFVPAGPRNLEPLSELIESVRCYAPAAKVVVMDDHTLDCRAPQIQARHPEVDVIRSRVPCCGPVRQYTQQGHAISRILRTHDFQVLIKMDTDALLSGADIVEQALADLSADPGVGLLGVYGTDGDGTPTDPRYPRWYLTHEVRWSRSIRELVAGAQAHGHDPSIHVQGGVYAVSRAALDRLDADGSLRWRQPWWSVISEDNLISLHVLAHGLRIRSWGAPGEPLASLPTRLPITLQETVDEGKLAVHSVRQGLHGEPEDEVRAFYRRLRIQHLDSPPST